MIDALLIRLDKEERLVLYTWAAMLDVTARIDVDKIILCEN